MSGPQDEERPGRPPLSQQQWQAPSQQPWQQPSPPPWQPFATWPGQQYAQQPVPWGPVGPPPFQPHAASSFSSVRGLGTAVSILICLVTLGQALFAVSDWYIYRVVKSYVEGPVKDTGSLDRADLFAGVVSGGYVLALAAAGVVFVVWLWRARRNAELFCAARHRRGRGWVIGAWFCPVVNLWFPKQVVDDVIAASDPRTPPHLPDLRGIRGKGLVLAWWLTWLASLVLGNMGGTNYASDVPDVNDQLMAAGLSTISAALTVVCAVLAIRVVSLVNRLQLSRPWTPWWATDPSAGQSSYGPVPPWPAY